MYHLVWGLIKRRVYDYTDRLHPRSVMSLIASLSSSAAVRDYSGTNIFPGVSKVDK